MNRIIKLPRLFNEKLKKAGYAYLPAVAAERFQEKHDHWPGEAVQSMQAMAALYAVSAYLQGRDGKPLEDLFPFVRPMD